jgi:hypothetical protein
MTHWETDNEDKLSWCALGEEQEIEFINTHTFKDTVLCINPEKDLDKYTFDMRINMPCDLKSIRTPWIYAQEKFGIDPKHAVSINQKDLRRYSELYPNIVIVFDVHFAEYKAIHFATISHFKKLLKDGEMHKHEYQNRKDDTKGNAKVSYVFNITRLPILR